MSSPCLTLALLAGVIGHAGALHALLSQDNLTNASARLVSNKYLELYAADFAGGTWSDRSGNGKTFQSRWYCSPPTTQVEDGLTALFFERNCLFSTVSHPVPQSLTIFAVVKWKSDGGQWAPIAAVHKRYWSLKRTINDRRFLMTGGSTDSPKIHYTLDKFYIVTGRVDSSTKTTSARIDDLFGATCTWPGCGAWVAGRREGIPGGGNETIGLGMSTDISKRHHEHFHGLIASVIMYDRALSDNEVESTLTNLRLNPGGPATPTVSPTASPTVYPTAAPTTALTPTGGSVPGSASGSGSAIGDPHLQNILGQRFDVMQPGKHTLLHIPRGASERNTLFHVQAVADHEGSTCSEMYFKVLNITGAWVENRHKGGYTYMAASPTQGVGWQTFGKVDVKVAWGRTLTGVAYLNFFVKHLSRTGYDIGGILGMDDFHQSAMPNAACQHVVMLLDSRGSQIPRESSVAVADM